MLKIISVNIEGPRHYERVLPFVRHHAPDVLCLQEAPERDIPMLAEQLDMPYTHFVPLTRTARGDDHYIIGEGVLSRLPLTATQAIKYAGETDGRSDFDTTTPASKYATSQYALAVVTVEKEGLPYQIATTHFLWTPDGQADDFQRQAAPRMLEKVAALGECVLCGDFNAPRGREIFSLLASKLTDNIPPHYITSLDKSLHRIGAATPDYMVDGLFTTPAYRAMDVTLHDKVSDHRAVVATITRT